MSAYLERAMESASSHAAYVAQVTTRGDADPTWLAGLRVEQRRREERVQVTRVEEGLAKSDPWPAEDRARFNSARANFRAALVRANPRSHERLAALQAAEAQARA